MNSHDLAKTGGLSFLMAALLLAGAPVTAYGQATTASEGARFCDNVDENREQALVRLAEREAMTDRSDTYESRRAERLRDLEATRSQADTARADRYDALRERATSDAQREAVDAFARSVESLVETRRATIDGAIDTFETTVESLLEERSTAIAATAADIEAEIERLFAAAADDCADGERPAQVRAELISGLRDLRTEQRAERDRYAFREDFQAARSERRATTADAWETFRDDLAAAKDELREAFGVN